MGRGRGKGRRLTVISHQDAGSGDEELLPAVRRRGRPQKLLKDKIDEEDSETNEEGGYAEQNTPSKEMKGASTENGRKRKKRIQQVKENSDSVLEENESESKPNIEEPTRSNKGFRQNGSRRKSQPRRAAGTGVKCN